MAKEGKRKREKSINDIDIYYPDLNHFESRFSFLKIERKELAQILEIEIC